MESSRAVSFALLSFTLFGLRACPGVETPSADAVVDSAAPSGAAAQAGLRHGDVLIGYRQGPAAGVLRSCADLTRVEAEQAPRGPVELQVRRKGKIFSTEVPAGEWQVEIVPLAAPVGMDDGCRAYARARRLTRERRWDEARTAWTEAARQATAARDEVFTAWVLQEQGAFLTGREEYQAAEQALRESLRRLRAAAPNSLTAAASWHALGRLEQRRGDFAASTADLRRALALRVRLAPESLERASTLNNLGIDAWAQGDVASARSLYLEALALVRRRFPGSQDEARVVNNLGLLARDAGDVKAAASYLGQAGRIWQRLDPDGVELARTYSNLGALASDSGDLALSEEYQREALRRFEAVAPESLEVAKVLTNLGTIARDRYDSIEANLLFHRALGIRQRLVPGSIDEAASLSNLAWVAQAEDRLDEAESFSRRALAIRSRHEPGSQDVALSLSMLAAIALARGDLPRAERLGGQALALERRIAPGTLREGEILHLLTGVSLGRRRWREAADRAEAAVAIRRRLAPDSQMAAESLNALGKSLWRTGEVNDAATALAAATDALEAQIGRLGGTDEARSVFQAMFSDIYQDLIALDIERGLPAEALRTLERRRARMLLAQIAQRGLLFSSEVPKRLLERQAALDAEYERTQQELAQLDARDPKLQALLVRLSHLRNERSALVDRIVRTSPHYAALRYPQPLDLEGARRALDPGTVWLSYSVGAEETFLFVLGAEASGEAGGLQVVRLSIGRKALMEEVATFRELILRGREVPTEEEALRVQGRKLYEILIAPAEPWAEGAERLLISPDGPLHTLPFAALVRPGNPEQYLVEWKPVHTVLSATLYAELKQGRRDVAGSGLLVAFADPLYRRAAGARPVAGDSPLRSYRAGLPALPGTREEVRELAALFGRDALVYTGAAATAARLEHLPVRPRYLHLACHALLDRRFPLDSALALATPRGDGAGDSGLLQAWQILGKLRLDADLVTLSACGTGLGREAAGEGLIGLSRAFLYAGARSVLASLWGVSDRSTPALMARFYALLREGRPKDAALAEAQRALLRSGQFSHPYSWAGFELNGDWR